MTRYFDAIDVPQLRCDFSMGEAFLTALTRCALNQSLAAHARYGCRDAVAAAGNTHTQLWGDLADVARPSGVVPGQEFPYAR